MPEAPAQPHTIESFERLLKPVLGPAYGTALQFARNAADAEELVQDASVQSFKAFHSFTPGTNFRAWFFRILTNLAIYRFRQRKRRPEAVGLEEIPDNVLWEEAKRAGPSEDPASVVIGRLDQARVSEALDALPEEFQVVCVLYFMDEFSYQEIAEILEVPIGTVRSRLHRGRKLLQRSLAEMAREHGIDESEDAR